MRRFPTPLNVSHLKQSKHINEHNHHCIKYMNRLSKMAIVSVFVIGIAYLQAQPFGQTRHSDDSLSVYPWDPDSAFQKVPKALLDSYPLQPIIYDHPDTLRMVPSEKWMRILGLEAVADQITELLLEAEREYYQQQKAHLSGMLHLVHDETKDFTEIFNLLPKGDGPFNRMYRDSLERSLTIQPLLETVTFIETPFHEEAQRIKETLSQKLVALGGSKRAELLWRNGQYMLSEFPMMKPAEKKDPRRRRRPEGPRFWIFRLEDLGDRREIGLHQIQGGGSHGRPFEEHRDAFLPDDMKPIMARWRQNKEAHHAVTGFKLPPYDRNPELFRDLQRTATDVPLPVVDLKNQPEWNEAASYFYLPKRAILDMQLAGLSLEENISPQFKSLFGLSTDQEVNRLKILYDEFQSRFESMEVKHLKELAPKKGAYELLPFPDEAQSLFHQWRKALAAEFGETRGLLMDITLQTPVTIPGMDEMRLRMEFVRDQNKDQSNALHPYQTLQLSRWVSWLNRGAASFKLRASTNMDDNGQPTFDVQFTPPEGQVLNFKVTPENLPNPLRHLLLPLLAKPPEGVF